MTQGRICLWAASIAVALLLTQTPAQADHKIKVDYDTFDDGGVVCVQDAPTIKQNDKSLTIKNLNQAITWELKLGSGADAGGTWVIERDAGGSIEMCPDTLSFTNGVATCTIGTKLEYAYELIWSKPGCDPVTADPAVIFDGGGGGPPRKFTLLGPIVGLVLGLALGYGLARRRLGAA